MAASKTEAYWSRSKGRSLSEFDTSEHGISDAEAKRDQLNEIPVKHDHGIVLKFFSKF